MCFVAWYVGGPESPVFAAVGHEALQGPIGMTSSQQAVRWLPFRGPGRVLTGVL